MTGQQKYWMNGLMHLAIREFMSESSKDKYYVQDKECGCWMHRSPLKCIINPLLRKIQFWTKEPLVICSNTDFDENGVPHFKGYGMTRTRVMTVDEYNELKKQKEEN